MSGPPHAAALPPAPAATGSLTALLAFACGLVVANLYYAQPLVGPIGRALGLTPAASGLIVTLTQVGYGCGLLLIVPLGDRTENRRLVVTLVCLCAVALMGQALSVRPLPFLLASFGIGLCSVAVQVLVPYAAHLAPDAARGRVVGNVMGGLMLGIMLARPVSSLLAQLAGWHTVFYAGAAAMLLIALTLHATLPPRRPATAMSYRSLLASMGRLAATTPVLQRRAAYQACLFAAFSLFWTTVPLLLSGPDFGLTQGGLAAFALAGAAGALASPLAGRMADRGWSRPATAGALGAVACAFALSRLGPPGSQVRLAALLGAAVVLDFGVTTNLVVGQRAIYGLGAELRSRLNGLYMATFFAGGAIGSAAGAWAYARGGWSAASWLGIALPLAALAGWTTERR